MPHDPRLPADAAPGAGKEAGGEWVTGTTPTTSTTTNNNNTNTNTTITNVHYNDHSTTLNIPVARSAEKRQASFHDSDSTGRYVSPSPFSSPSPTARDDDAFVAAAHRNSAKPSSLGVARKNDDRRNTANEDQPSSGNEAKVVVDESKMWWLRARESDLRPETRRSTAAVAGRGLGAFVPDGWAGAAGGVSQGRPATAPTCGFSTEAKQRLLEECLQRR